MSWQRTGTCLLITVLQSAGPHVKAGTQLLTNPGFEQGTVGWFPWPNDASFTVISSPVHGGRRAARLNKDSAPGPAHIYQDVTASPGQFYTLSGPSVSYVRLRVEWRDADGQVLRTDEATLGGSSPAYRFITSGLRQAPSGTAAARVQAYAYFAK